MVLLLTALIVGCIIYHRKVTKYKTDLGLLKARIDEQNHRIDDLKEQERKIAKIRHDYKNHVITGLSLLKNGETLRAQEYFSKYIDQELSKVQVYVDTSNALVNAVVNEKFRLCYQKGITAEAEISFVEQKIDDIDLCAVLFNLLDNAIEACEKLDKERSLKLVIFQHKAYLVVRVENTSGDNVLENNPSLKTTKADKAHHGLGVRIVKDIVKKYNGVFNVDNSGGKFSAEAWLENI